MTRQSEISKLKFPDWYDRCLELYVQTGGCRPTSEALKAEGFNVSHTTVWLWMTAAGQEKLMAKMTPEHRDKQRRYMRNYMRERAKSKGNSEDV